MYGRVYTCFVQLGLSLNLGQEKQGGGWTLQNVCYPAMCIPLCGIFIFDITKLARKSQSWLFSLGYSISLCGKDLPYICSHKHRYNKNHLILLRLCQFFIIRSDLHATFSYFFYFNSYINNLLNCDKDSILHISQLSSILLHLHFNIFKRVKCKGN